MKNLGFFAGSFNPVHRGHIAFAQAALESYELGEILFLPERQPRDKLGVIDFKDRVQMLELATAAHPALKVLEMPEDQFDLAQTFPKLKKMTGGKPVVLLVGSDVAASLGNWSNVGEHSDELSFVVGIRAGEDEKNLAQKLSSLGVKAQFLTADFSDLTSTQARLHPEAGIDAKVNQYIKGHNLYQKSYNEEKQ